MLNMKTSIDFLKNKSTVGIVAFFVVLLASIIFLSTQSGMNGDEHYQSEHAENVLNYYRTFGNDTAAVRHTPDWNLPLYGQVIDNLASLVAKGLNIENYMLVRHIVCSIFGWLGILFVSLMAFRVSGSRRAAVFAALLLFLSPRFLGHSF
ncbi:MAG: hypothetical protein PHF49_04750, partial [Patescibacteria group bacterium]|nr:hypothetical protein [Patescibacteria group bacterium]